MSSEAQEALKDVLLSTSSKKISNSHKLKLQQLSAISTMIEEAGGIDFYLIRETNLELIYDPKSACFIDPKNTSKSKHIYIRPNEVIKYGYSNVFDAIRDLADYMHDLENEYISEHSINTKTTNFVVYIQISRYNINTSSWSKTYLSSNNISTFELKLPYDI